MRDIMSNQIRFTRRRFIQATAATSAWALGANSYNRVFGANDRLNIAFIGTGGIATSQHLPMLSGPGLGCACYCDADAGRFGPAASRFPDAKGYTDYRQMYDKQMKDIDAVSVATPDHHHYPATIIAMMNGKHTYTQKPLTHTIWESRQLALAAEKYKVATQMGNQMHANEANRRIVEWIRSGKLGVIKEAHIWTNRPVWPQGNPTPRAASNKPASLNWDAWLGPAPARPFVNGYHPFNWRGAMDYGTGALGDMACHYTDGLYWGMDPGLPTAAELVEGEPVGGLEQYDKQSVVKFEYPEKDGRPAFDYFWYEGGKMPAKPDFIEVDLRHSGGLIIGDKGAIQFMDDAVNTIMIHSFGAPLAEPAKTLERSEGHHKEWILACKGEKAYDYPRSCFKYASKLTESALLGTIAQKVGGRIEYEAKTQTITNNPIANAMVTKEYRAGWDFKMS